MKDKLRASPQTLRLLEALLAKPAAWHYGYDLSRLTTLKSGTLYPILMRLANRHWLKTRWAKAQPGKPPRHLYRLTSKGFELAGEIIHQTPSAAAPHRAALEGAKTRYTEKTPRAPWPSGC